MWKEMYLPELGHQAESLLLIMQLVKLERILAFFFFLIEWIMEQNVA